MTVQSPAGTAIEQFLGRPATAAELDVYVAQKAKLEAGIFDNALIPKVIRSAEPGQLSRLRTGLVTTPFVPCYRSNR